MYTTEINTDVVIVSYHDFDPLKVCLTGIYDNFKHTNIIIISNNKVNRGFTKGCNEGIKRGKNPYVWLINSDAVPLPGAMGNLIARLQDPKIGAVSSMQLDPDDNDVQRYAGVGSNSGYPYGVHLGGRISSGSNLNPTKEIWLNFASVMIKRSVIEEIGLLDEKFFMYYSDSDYSYRIRKAGYECWYEPSSRVIHKLNSSAGAQKSILDSDKAHFEEKWVNNPDSGWDKLSIIP